MLPLLLLALLALSGCHGPGEDASIRQSLGENLKQEESAGTATVNFDQLISGSWTHVVFICLGATTKEVDSALGFTWSDFPGLTKDRAALVVFTTDNAVEKYTEIGEGALSRDIYFTPCVPPDIAMAEPRVISLARSNSAVRYVFEPKKYLGPVWYPTEGEWLRLAE